MVLLVDEAGFASPALYATLNARAFWGRLDMHQLDISELLNVTFGNILLQLVFGDFGLLKPVPRGARSLGEAFLKEADSFNELDRVDLISDMDRAGLRFLDQVSVNTIEFQGTYRYAEGDPLIQLLQAMRVPGGRKLDSVLKAQVESRIRCADNDPRMAPTFRFPAPIVNDCNSANNFFNGMFSAVNWEQVSRLQQVWVMRNATLTVGPTAMQNTKSGSPVWYWTSFPPAACKGIAHIFLKSLGRQAGCRGKGQLVVFIQRVDRPAFHQYAEDRRFMRSALEVVNMTKTARLQGFCSLYRGMPVKINTRLMPPDLVPETTAEVLECGFHEEECFGMPRNQNASPWMWPHASHPCWKRGWVVLDRVPRYIVLRVHGSSTDYTGTGKPGVYLLEPCNGQWDMEYRAEKVVNHPNARPAIRTAPKVKVAMSSTQLAISPARVGTFNNFQGKTCRDDDKQALGHSIDLKMQRSDDVWAHYYMIIGRATSLSTTLFFNFPKTVDGEYDWSVFESGPPEDLVQVFAEIQRRYWQT